MGGVGWYVQGFAGLEKQVMKKVCEEGAAVMRVLAHQVGAEDVRRSRRRGGFDFAGQVVEQGGESRRRDGEHGFAELSEGR